MPDSHGATLSPGVALPSVIGHRGAAGRAPENTLAGLRRARTLGCRWVEFDVRLCADGELILLHDDRLDRTTNGRGEARALPLSEIRTLDAGAWFSATYAGENVPSLREAIAVLGELGIGANIELKAAPRCAAETGAAAADLLTRLWPAQLPPPLISSFAAEALAAARERAPAIARGLLRRVAVGRWRALADRLGCSAIGLDHRLLGPASVAEIRKAGYSVLAYTVNDPGRARELFDWGVASVFSDVPDLLLAALPAAPVRAAAPVGAVSARRGIAS